MTSQSVKHQRDLPWRPSAVRCLTCPLAHRLDDSTADEHLEQDKATGLHAWLPEELLCN